MARKEFYSEIRSYSGISFNSVEIDESDFSLPNGEAYSPPEEGVYRRINVSRTIQLLGECPNYIETFQTSSANLRLPANTASYDTNDAGNGRFFNIKNNGTSSLIIQDYLGNDLYILIPNSIIFITSIANNVWRVFSNYKNDIKEPTGFPDTSLSTISFNDSNRTFTISPISNYFYYFIQGEQYIKTTPQSIQISDTEGAWFIYFENDALTASQTPWDFDEPKAFVCVLYWDSTNKKAIYFAEERHGIVMPWSVHRLHHEVYGTQIVPKSFILDNFTLSGDGSSDSHAQVSLSNGIIFDEDLVFNVINSSNPSQPFEQKLSTIAYIPIYYKIWNNDLNKNVWRKLNATSFPIISNSPNTIYYNRLYNGQYSLTNINNGYYTPTWIIATNNIYEPIIGILGQNQSSSLDTTNLTYENLDLTDFPFQEFKFLYRLVFQSDTSYTNNPKAALRSIGDIIMSGSSKQKTGIVSPSSFSGNPKKATIIFATPYLSTNYSINITGMDGRIWTYENKQTNSFVINSNANKELNNEVSWHCTLVGET